MTQVEDAQSEQINICYCVKIILKLAPVGFHLLSRRTTTGPDLPRMTFFVTGDQMRKVWQMWSQLKLRHKKVPSGIWIGICDSSWYLFLQRLDSSRYFDDIYDSKIKFAFKYPVHMVIYCKKSDLTPSILWGDIRNLSQILHYPGAVSAKSVRHSGLCN